MTVKEDLCFPAKNVQHVLGMPQLQVHSGDNEGIVQFYDDAFTIWFAKGRQIDSRVQQENVTFLFSQDELIGIKAVDIRLEGTSATFLPPSCE